MRIFINSNNFFYAVFCVCFSLLLAESDSSVNSIVFSNGSSNKKESLPSVINEVAKKHNAVATSSCKGVGGGRGTLLKKVMKMAL